MTGKVVAIVTRRSHFGGDPEILVFQHPMAGVQLPAGSLFDGEDPEDGCRREIYGETGLGDDDVRLVAEIGHWDEESTGLTRRAFQLQCPPGDRVPRHRSRRCRHRPPSRRPRGHPGRHPGAR